MTMLVLVVLFTCTCALDVEVELEEGNLRETYIKSAVQILSDNILSMDGNIPLMDDPRRHYAVILNVVYSQAVEASACTEQGYLKNYQKNLNLTVHVGLIYPQEVVDATKKLIDDVLYGIGDVSTLLNRYGQSNDEIKKNEQLAKAEKIFLAAGLAAKELYRDHDDYFSPRSQKLSSLRYVIDAERHIRDLVMAVHNLSKVTYGIPDCKQ